MSELTMSSLKAHLQGHIGTINWYRDMFNPKSLYTDGVKDLLETAACYWLYDIIKTEVYDVLRKKNVADTYYFQIVVDENMRASMTLADYQSEVLWEREIAFTTFPEGTFDLICGWDGDKLITCLPSEN